MRLKLITMIAVISHMDALSKETTKIMLEVLAKMDEEITAAIETIEILSDEELLKSIEEGLEDIKRGDVLPLEKFLEKHGYK
ncbi:MAG: hypothetical protein OD815_001928 [Candidatus Alkanophagales archaeon MCA70_species_2]|nr:hypothetical protein [Candidatus Alkanophaga liquidiphilum]